MTFGNDDGHQGSDTGFTKNDEALRNWASDAHKKTCDVGMTIIKPAYGGTVMSGWRPFGNVIVVDV